VFVILKGRLGLGGGGGDDRCIDRRWEKQRADRRARDCCTGMRLLAAASSSAGPRRDTKATHPPLAEQLEAREAVLQQPRRPQLPLDLQRVLQDDSEPSGVDGAAGGERCAEADAQRAEAAATAGALAAGFGGCRGRGGGGGVGSHLAWCLVNLRAHTINFQSWWCCFRCRREKH